MVEVKRLCEDFWGDVGGVKLTPEVMGKKEKQATNWFQKLNLLDLLQPQSFILFVLQKIQMFWRALQIHYSFWQDQPMETFNISHL